MIIPGTTPKHNFILPCGVNEIQKVEITYKQNGKVILQKHTEDCTLQDNVVGLKLTQEDTLAFDDKCNVKIRMRAKTISGDVIGSDAISVSCDECFSDEVL